MTGEKLRSLRRDHKPSKEDGDLLAPGEEEAAAAPGGIFTGGRGSSGKGGRAGGHRIFSNHHHRLPLKGGPAAGGTGPPAEPDKCPAHFPVHECVFKGDVRRLSALIRTQGIGQKDSHVRGPKLNPALEVRPHQCQVQGDDHCPTPAGHTIPYASQDAVVLLGHLGTLLAHVHQLLTSTPRSFSSRQLSSHSSPSL
ncbi:ankyrin repeat domain-containing protein 13C [Grus japonensis]|uniref:Ankyrin repeat domain-containing protein 13C n=1 Tax=Grus japonensis TaxID=30415 RepID=A0ABC9X6N0_GRUJA